MKHRSVYVGTRALQGSSPRSGTGRFCPFLGIPGQLLDLPGRFPVRGPDSPEPDGFGAGSGYALQLCTRRSLAVDCGLWTVDYTERPCAPLAVRPRGAPQILCS
jgi:hypothetical protein